MHTRPAQRCNNNRLFPNPREPSIPRYSSFRAGKEALEECHRVFVKRVVSLRAATIFSNSILVAGSLRSLKFPIVSLSGKV